MNISSLNHVNMVFAPISNQEGEWFKNDDCLLDHMASSSLYLIGQREEVFFDSVVIDFPKIKFALSTTISKQENLILDVMQFNLNEDVEIQAGPKILKFKEPDGGIWLTPDRLFWSISRGLINVENFSSRPEYKDIKLHYVGISKTQSAFERLFHQSHKTRCSILSNEHPLRKGARVTDELLMFLFQIDQLRISTLQHDDEVDDFVPMMNFLSDGDRLTSDLEKGIAYLLQPKYNSILYQQYPKSKDGLFDENQDSYGYTVNDDYKFTTETDSLRGAHYLTETFWDPKAKTDMIGVRGEQCELRKYENLNPQTK